MISIFICTDKEKMKELVKNHLHKDTLPYVRIIDESVSYDELVLKVDDLEEDIKNARQYD